jgi:hypothetical protein
MSELKEAKEKESSILEPKSATIPILKIKSLLEVNATLEATLLKKLMKNQQE